MIGLTYNSDQVRSIEHDIIVYVIQAIVGTKKPGIFENPGLKVGLSPSKKIFLFGSMLTLQK